MNNQTPIHQEVKDVRKNYTRTPNILFESYLELHPQEKWLYINLVYLCGSRGTHHLSLRYISEKTGISLGALSGSKNPQKNNPGMIRNLHNAGLIHAEIKKVKREGKEKDQAQYHITITDIWQMNEAFFLERKRSKDEHFDIESVRKMNTSSEDDEQKCSSFEQERSENEQERSENDTNIRLHSNTTSNKDNSAALADASTQTSSPSPEEEEEPKKKPRKRVPRNRKQEPIVLEEEVRGRVEKFFGYVDTLGQQVTHDSEFHFAQDNAAIQAVVDILPLKPTESKIKQLFLSMWNAPRSQNGFLWQEHMDIPNICKEFKRKNIQLSVQSAPTGTNGTNEPAAAPTSYALKYREKAAKFEHKEAK